MRIFEFYGLDNLQCNEKGALLTSEAEPEANAADFVQLFGSLFKDNKPIELVVPNAKGDEQEIFKGQVLRHVDGVVLLYIEANRKKRTIVDRKEVEHDHHPYCHIIIDNRPNHQLVGIERGSAFANTDKVAEILTTGLSVKMYDYRRGIKLSRLTKSTIQLWDVVDEIVKTFSDRVTQVRIDYTGAGSKDKKKGANHFLALISALAEKSGSDALFSLTAKDQSGVQLSKIRNDMQHIAEICLEQSDYGLAVKFEKFGVYRYGANLVAQFCVDDKVTEHFALGMRVFDYDEKGEIFELVQWLNQLKLLIDNNYQHESLQPKRTRRRRR